MYHEWQRGARMVSTLGGGGAVPTALTTPVSLAIDPITKEQKKN